MDPLGKVSKAVILARGLGTRMRVEDAAVSLDPEQEAAASAGLKTLVPIADGKTLLDFIFENLIASGFTKICMVIGEEHDVIRNFCGSKPYDISFAIQKEPLGTADAVLAAEEFAGDDLFLVINSDNLYPVESLRRLREAGVQGLVAFDHGSRVEHSNIPEERISKFADVVIGVDGSLKEIVEKPEHPREDGFVSMNTWLFSPRIFEACRAIGPSPRGEYEITAAVAFAIDQLGERFNTVRSYEGVLDLSSRADIGAVAGFLKGSR